MPTPVKKCRYIDVWINESWMPVHLQQLAPNDIFRMWEASGEPVKDEKGNSHFICARPAEIKCDAFTNPLPRKESPLT